MPYRSLLYRAVALAALAVAGVMVAAFALLRHPAAAPAPVAVTTHAASPPTDPLADAFARLQHAFVHDEAALPSEHALDETVRLLRGLDAYVEVTWTEESLLLAERRIQHLETLFRLWGLHEGQVALTSARGAPRVTVVRYPPLLTPPVARGDAMDHAL